MVKDPRAAISQALEAVMLADSQRATAQSSAVVDAHYRRFYGDLYKPADDMGNIHIGDVIQQPTPQPQTPLPAPAIKQGLGKLAQAAIVAASLLVGGGGGAALLHLLRGAAVPQEFDVTFIGADGKPNVQIVPVQK